MAGEEEEHSTLQVSFIDVHVNVTNSACEFCDFGVKGDHNLQ